MKNKRTLLLINSLIVVLLCVFYNCKNNSGMQTNGAKDELSIIGIAENTKSGAAVVTANEEVYYIEGKQDWDKEGYAKKKVRVSGTRYVVTTKKEDLVNSKGEYTQGAEGDRTIIKMIKCSLVE